MRLLGFHCRGLLAGLLAVGAGRAAAQVVGEVEPRWLRLRIPEVSLGAEVEALREDVTLNGSRSTHEYLTYPLIPLMGLRAQGSIYHPNLISFDLNGEGGWNYTYDTVTSPGSVQTRNEDQKLWRGLGQVNFLPGKPYNGSIFASRDHTFQDYDFFNTATVDSLRYGGRAAWLTKDFNLTTDVGYRNEQSSSLSGDSEISDTYLNFTGINTRRKGSSTLTYNFDEFQNTLNEGNPLNSVNNSVGVSDSETFGSRDQITTTLGAGYSEYEYLDQQTRILSANASGTVHHRPDLDSFCNLNYSHSSMDPSETSTFQGVAGLRHQLYASLASTLDAHGSYDESSNPTGVSTHGRYGLGLNEDYRKRLGDWGRLTLGGGIVGDHEDYQTSGSVIITTIDEPHPLYLMTSPNYRPAYLNKPQVIASTIEVRGPGGIPTQVNVDYEVIPSGELTEVRLIQGSTILHDGDRVTVTYQSISPGDVAYESLTGNAQIRVDLFNMFGVYGRLNWVDNNAPPEALTETLTDLVGGADATWRWLRAGAEYEDYDSSYTQYKAWRFFQTFNFQPAEGSTLGIDFSQIFYTYPDDRRDTRYRFMAHLNSQLAPWLQWNLEGGYYLQDVFGTEQNMGAARTSFNFHWGKLSMRAGYQYNYQLTTQPGSTERRDRNFLYLYLKRTF